MKTLIIVSHPNLEHSVINAECINALSSHRDAYTVHHLDKVYPDGKIDVKAEQALVEQHGTVILQFPIYWFSCPPLLKQWLDDVLTHGWAYGSQAVAFKGRKMGLAVSHGTPKNDYQATGRIQHTLTEVLTPFQSIANYIGAHYLPPFTTQAVDTTQVLEANFERMMNDAKQSAQALLEHLQQHA